MSEKDPRKEALKKRETTHKEMRGYWMSIVKDFSSMLRNDKVTSIIPLEAELLSRREELVDEIARLGVSVQKDNIQLKQIKEERLKWQIEKQQFKITATERKVFIEADMAYHDALVELTKNHIEFLIDTKSTVDHFIWGIKNKIALFKEIGMD